MSSTVQPNPNFFRCIFCCILGIDPFATSRIQQKMPRTLLHKLSRLTIVNAKPGPKPYTLSDGGRLYILVQPDGTKLWRWNYLFAGKTKTMALGTWPEVTEKEARAVHTAARERLRKGLDPMRERREAKAQARLRASATFEHVATDWIREQKAHWSASYLDKIERRLKKNAFPWLADRPIGEIATPEYVAVIHRARDRGVPDTARRVRETCNCVFRHAVENGLIKSSENPAIDPKVGGIRTPAVKHYAAIVDPEALGQLIRSIRSYKGTPIVRTALQFTPLVFQRPGQVRAARWEQFDLNQALWICPAAMMKGKLERKESGPPHLVPLSRQAVAILRELHPLTGSTGYVFPSRKAGLPMSDGTINAALRTLGYSGQEMTGHGFRATGRTLIRERLGYAKEVVERHLAHGSDEELGDAYDRAQFFFQRQKMVQDWADYLDLLAAQKFPDTSAKTPTANPAGSTASADTD
ncbi:integrase arm-type DNA-binding domain-containing protein [Paraburkholderia sediminicola]|uniref:tyrosine-type recombinase/integrase n=1 Tax=Paraburkholderia sediminicola TaxID=458836 RepID=UPI0038BCE7CA